MTRPLKLVHKDLKLMDEILSDLEDLDPMEQQLHRKVQEIIRRMKQGYNNRRRNNSNAIHQA